MRRPLGAVRRPLGAAIPCGAAALLIVLTLATGGAAAAASPPSLSVRGAVLIEQSTGKRLYGRDPNRELPIASATKLMTALLTLEHERRLSKVFTQTDYYPAAADSQIGLVPGERMSVHDLLLALMLPSADDAAEDLAYNVGHRSVRRFIAMMNARARQLGLRHTHYSTPIGLDSPGNYSSASDLVKLASYDLTHSPYVARIVALPYATLRSGDHIRHVVNRNDLVGRVPWINGVKTGHTAGAGYVLVASGHRRGMSLLSAVLGTSSEGSRDANTMALLDYGFATFRLAKPVRAGQVLARPTVAYRPGVRAALVAATAFTRAVSRQTKVMVRVRAPRQLTGPLRRHTELGTAIVLADGRPIALIPLLLARALPAVGTLTIAARFITGPVVLPVIAAVLLTVLALGFLARRHRRTRMGPARGEPGGGGLESA
ncbi:MAG: D-alanyl-D-alanine carboxypeptidase family protein [Solirubrobacteraceae bacterium]